MKTITRFIYAAVAVVALTIGAVATSADRGGRFASINVTGANGNGSIHRYTPSGVRSIIVSGPHSVAVPISHTRTLSNVDYVVAGVGGVGGGSGTITIAGVSGTVTHAYLSLARNQRNRGGRGVQQSYRYN